MLTITNIELKWTRILGCYLLCVAAFQIYVSIEIANGEIVFFYILPHFGIHAFLLGIVGTYNLMLIEWLTAGWIIALAVLFLLGQSPIKIYIISEILLSMPSFFFICLVIIASMKRTHGFSPLELMLPVIIMLITAFIPIGLILWWRIRKSSR